MNTHQELIPLADARRDRDLANAAQRGDGDALRALYVEHAPALFHSALRLVGSRPDAEDIVQDIFTGLPEALRSWRAQGPLRGWLRRIAVRLALQRLRAQRRRGEVVLDNDLAGAARAPDAAIDQAILVRALARLPSSLRVVFILKEVEGYSHEDIGRELGIAVNASEVRLHRARRRLRELIGVDR